MTLNSKIIKNFPFAVVNKSASTTTLLNFLELPSDCKNWLCQKFTDKKTGRLNAYLLSEYVKKMRLKPEEFNMKMLEARHSSNGQIKFLSKVRIEFDYDKDIIKFFLDEYQLPKKTSTSVEWNVISKYKSYFLNPNGVWGEITIQYDCSKLEMINFVPLCPYSYDLKTFREKREHFTLEEWIDVLLGGLGFNSNAYDKEGKIALLERFLPLVESRLNMIEASIKGSGKSYCYSQVSKYSWLTAGSLSRATAFYNNTTKKTGYFFSNDTVTFDEIQTMAVNKPEEMAGMLKTYLESGEVRIGNFVGNADAGLTLVGNVNINKTDFEKQNVLNGLPKMWNESAVIDRFSLIIDGIKIGRFSENKRATGFNLSAEYLTGMFHELRSEFYYRAIIDEMLIAEEDCDVRNFEQIKRVATALLKLLFPHVTSVDDIDVDEFREWVLEPAIKGRYLVLCQLRFIDGKEYNAIKMPKIKIKNA